MIPCGIANFFKRLFASLRYQPLMLIAEAVGRIHHAEDLHDALDAVEAAQRSSYFRQHDQSRLPRRLVALLDSHVSPDLAVGRPLTTRSSPG